jgi:hypothetical protein
MQEINSLLKKKSTFSALTLAATLLATPFTAQADLSDDVKRALQTNQGSVEAGLKDFSKNMTAVFAHRGLAPADTLGGGIFGFEVGLDVSNVDFDSDALKKALNAGGGLTDSDYDISSIPLPKLSAGIGFPVIPLDIAVTYLPDVSGFSYMSAAIKYDVIEGGVAMPAVAVTGSYSSAKLADAFDTTTYGIDASISKGFGVGVKFVPYAGVGYVSGNTTIDDKAKPAGTTIKTSYDNSDTKLFAGASLQLGIFNLVGQWDQIGSYNAVSGKIGFRF